MKKHIKIKEICVSSEQNNQKGYIIIISTQNTLLATKTFGKILNHSFPKNNGS